MTRELWNLLERGGMPMPGLARPGGYGFEEFQQNQSRSAGSSAGVAPGVGVNTGKLSDSNPLSPQKQVASFDVEPSFGSSKTRSSDAVAQTMTRFDMLNRALPRLRVAPNAIITVVLTARNERDWIDMRKLGTWLGGGRVAVRFRVRDAAELGLSPEKSIDLGLYHPQGIPVSAGTFFPPPERRPAATSTDDLVRAAFLVPFMRAGFTAIADWDGQRFRAATAGSPRSSSPPRSAPGSGNSRRRPTRTSPTTRSRRRSRAGWKAQTTPSS